MKDRRMGCKKGMETQENVKPTSIAADVRNSLWLLPNYVSRGKVKIEGLRNLKTGFERRLLQGMKECRIGCKKGTET